ncbi:pirin family protein [Cytophaga hutchinsonii]|nr:pirin family protein [Cytophaga hutchinsonii]SFX20771.1 hypothetical protein SAMN04487930_10247 [Cytophaga hutchinsonii ATCC 33406]
MTYRSVYIIMLLMTVSSAVAAQQPGRVYPAIPAMDGEGAEVLRLFPGKFVKHADPFILLDDFTVSPPVGFPTHKHIGFEAITYMIEGSFVHKDNIGNNDTVYAGQAQRFTAGSGLLHSEMPGASAVNRGLQLWVNIPAAAKAAEPTYQLVETLPVESADSTRIVRTIAGKGSVLQVHCGCDLSYLDIQLKKNTIVLTPESGYTSFVYVLDGMVQIHEHVVYAGNFYFLESGVPNTIIGDGVPRFVYLSAKPLNQKIKQRGPYVY